MMVECNFKIGRSKGSFMENPKEEDYKEIDHYDCALTQGNSYNMLSVGIMLCNEKLCPHQQQLKLLKEIKDSIEAIKRDRCPQCDVRLDGDDRCPDCGCLSSQFKEK